MTHDLKVINGQLTGTWGDKHYLFQTDQEGKCSSLFGIRVEGMFICGFDLIQNGMYWLGVSPACNINGEFYDVDQDGLYFRTFERLAQFLTVTHPLTRGKDWAIIEDDYTEAQIKCYDFRDDKMLLKHQAYLLNCVRSVPSEHKELMVNEYLEVCKRLTEIL